MTEIATNTPNTSGRTPLKPSQEPLLRWDPNSESEDDEDAYAGMPEGLMQELLEWSIHEDPTSLGLSDWDSLGLEFEREANNSSTSSY